MAPESIIETQNAVVQGMRTAATKAGAEFDTMAGKLHQAMAKTDPGQALLISLRKAVSQLEKDPSLKGLENRFDGLVRKAVHLGDVGAQYIAGSGLSIARQAQGRDPGQYDFEAMKQFGEVTSKSFNDIRTTSQDLVTALKKLKSVTQDESAKASAHIAFNGTYRSLLRERDPDGTSFYNSNRKGYMKLSRALDEADRTEFMERLGSKYDAINKNYHVDDSSYDDKVKANALAVKNRVETDQRYYAGLAAKYDSHNQSTDGSRSSFIMNRENADKDRNRNILYGDLSQRTHRGDYSPIERGLRSSTGDGDGRAASFWDKYSFDSDMSPNQRRRQNASIQRDIHKENVRTGTYMPGHNFRFASQNIGFGIDDAIQSYHYGGAGASIRAASNNLTAVAGMTIPNPIIAATAVVGLSMFTAALPTILRKMGLDEDREKAESLAADANYKRDGSTGGAIRRKSAGLSNLQNQISSFHKISDFNNTQDMLAGQATAYFKNLGMTDYQIAHLKDEGHLGRDALENRGGNYHQLKDYDAKVSFLTKYQEQGAIRRQNYNESVAHLQLLEKRLPEVFRAQEVQRVTDESFDHRLHNATSTTEYQNILRARRDTEIHRIMQDPDMSGQDKAAELRLVHGEYQDKVYRKQEIEDTTRNNAIRRRTFMEDQKVAAFGGQSSVEAITQASQRRMEAIQNDRSIAPADKQALLANEQAGLNRQLGMADFSTRMYKEQMGRASMGYTGSLGNLSLAAQQRQHDIINNLNLSDIDRGSLFDKNTTGFSKQREEMMLGMVASGRVNSPLGHLYDNIRQRGTQLQSDFEEGFTSPEEQETLTGNFKTLVKKQLRDAHTPSGTERFLADAMTVGSSADRELQFRALGNFSEIMKNNDVDKLSLDQLIIMAKELAQVNSKLEIARSHL